MLKVITVVGTRPELIKMSRVIAALDEHFEHVLVHSGQNYDYELNQVFFEDLEIRKPDHFLSVAGKTSSQTIASAISSVDEVIRKENPDAILFYGDTNTCMGVIAAKRNKVPVFHMEAGNRCFDERVPEELNRKVVDHLSDINLVLSEHARRYLLAEGKNPQTVIKTGSHMPEVLSYYGTKIEQSKVLKNLNLEKGKFFIVSAHREENVDSEINLNNLLESLNTIAQKYDYPVIVSTHPRTKKRLENLNSDNIDTRIRFLKPFGFFDYLKLQSDALCVISDSGTITEEASILGFSAITIRNAHERPEGDDRGILIMSGLKKDRIVESINILLKQKSQPDRVDDYDHEMVSNQIVRIIAGYTDYVNRTVWKKY